MERRLLSFIIASTAFFMFYLSLRLMFAPPMPPQEVKPADAAAEQLVDQDPSAETSEPAVDPAVTDAAAPLRPKQAEWFTLGSMKSDSGYHLLITLNSQGGGVERVELTERDDRGRFRYRRVDVRHGYVGYLAAEPAIDREGAVVKVVGPGTPADEAGLQVDDVIVSIAGQTIASREDIDRVLEPTRPGDTVAIEIVRAGSGEAMTVQAKLSEHPLDLVRLSRDGGADEVLGNLSPLSCLMTLSQVNRKGILPDRRSITGSVDPMELMWTASRASGEAGGETQGELIKFELELSEAEMQSMGGKPARLVRTYRLVPKSYDVEMSIQIDNLAQEPQDLAYRLEGANGITLEGWWYSNKISPHWSGGAAARDVVCRTAASGHRLLSGFNLLKRAKKEIQDPNETIFAADSSQDERQLKYIGVDAQYFAVAYVPTPDSTDFTNFRRASAGLAADANLIPRHQERAVNVTYFLDSVIASVPAGGSMRQDLRLFAGPKQPELLADHGLDDLIYYGWFSWFAQVLAGLLHALYGVGNYAIAIILLTVIVRACMFPLSRKAAINAQKMQELAPEIKKINEQYKDDMEGKLKAQRELQQRVGFNPLAGCLPMFLQLPIFIGLYRALSVDIELRQAAVSNATHWASNLAGPDMLLEWGSWLWEYLSGRGTGWLGPYFNILPVIVVVLFLVQQKMFMPPATDEQTAMTQKMMNIMTLMMGLFFFRVPAGLCIYFITSSLWGICERVMVKKTLPTTPHFSTAVLQGTAGPVEKPQSIVDRIRNQVTKPEPPIERPNKRRRPPKNKA